MCGIRIYLIKIKTYFYVWFTPIGTWKCLFRRLWQTNRWTIQPTDGREVHRKIFYTYKVFEENFLGQCIAKIKQKWFLSPRLKKYRLGSSETSLWTFMSVCWFIGFFGQLDGWLFGWSVCHKFLRGGKLHFHAPIEALDNGSGWSISVRFFL